MTSRRHGLAEMTALYLIPIVAIVIAATSGALVVGVLKDVRHQLWTLMISYVFWGIGTPLSWIILTVYFLRMMVHKPLQREVIVSLLLPIGPISLSGFSYVKPFFDIYKVPHPRSLTMLQTDIARKGCQIQLPIERNSPLFGSGWRDIPPCRLDHRYHTVGICNHLVRYRCSHDSYHVPFPVQHGLVGLHISFW